MGVSLAAGGAFRVVGLAQPHDVGCVETQVRPVTKLRDVVHLVGGSHIAEGLAVRAERVGGQICVTEGQPLAIVSTR
jgi:hypothetical protein